MSTIPVSIRTGRVTITIKNGEQIAAIIVPQ